MTRPWRWSLVNWVGKLMVKDSFEGMEVFSDAARGFVGDTFFVPLPRS